jgi:DNA-binding transcriptional MocR family regulator
LWITLGPAVDATAFAQVALRHGVEVVAGAAADPDGNHDSHIRVPFTFPVPVLTEVVARLKRAWHEFEA